MNNIGDKYTFYYNGDEWEDLKPAQECAEAMARVTSKGETICLCKATHEVMEVYNGERE